MDKEADLTVVDSASCNQSGGHHIPHVAWQGRDVKQQCHGDTWQCINHNRPALQASLTHHWLSKQPCGPCSSGRYTFQSGLWWKMAGKRGQAIIAHICGLKTTFWNLKECMLHWRFCISSEKTFLWGGTIWFLYKLVFYGFLPLVARHSFCRMFKKACIIYAWSTCRLTLHINRVLQDKSPDGTRYKGDGDG